MGAGCAGQHDVPRCPHSLTPPLPGAQAGREWGCVGQLGGSTHPAPASGCTPSPAFVYRVPPQLPTLPQGRSHPRFSFRGPRVPCQCRERRPKVPTGGWAEESHCPSSGHRLALQPPLHTPRVRAAGRPCPGRRPDPPMKQVPATGCPRPLPELTGCSGNRAGRPARLRKEARPGAQGEPGALVLLEAVSGTVEPWI